MIDSVESLESVGVRKKLKETLKKRARVLNQVEITLSLD